MYHLHESRPETSEKSASKVVSDTCDVVSQGRNKWTKDWPVKTDIVPQSTMHPGKYSDWEGAYNKFREVIRNAYRLSDIVQEHIPERKCK